MSFWFGFRTKLPRGITQAWGFSRSPCIFEECHIRKLTDFASDFATVLTWSYALPIIDIPHTFYNMEVLRSIIIVDLLILAFDHFWSSKSIFAFNIYSLDGLLLNLNVNNWIFISGRLANLCVCSYKMALKVSISG